METNQLSHEEKCKVKFMQRKNRLIKRNIYPLGYNSMATWINEKIELRASIARDTEATKNMIWQCNASNLTAKQLNNATIFELYRIFPNTNIKEKQSKLIHSLN